MSLVADSLQITGDRLGGAQEADDERSGVADDMAADAVATTEVVDDDDVDDASDDGDVEAAFAAHTKHPPRSQNQPRPVSAAVAQHSATAAAAAADAAASRARPQTATARNHQQPGADGVGEGGPARRSLTASRKRQTGRLSADHIEKLTAMLRTAVNATGSNCGLLNAAHNPLGLSRPASAAAPTSTQSRPTSAAPAGAGRAAARASRPGTAHPTTRSRPTSAAAAEGARPPSAASTTRQRPQSATSSARHHDFQSSVRSASGAGAAFNQPTSSFAALERRYLDGIASSKHETLRRAKLTSRSLYRRYAGGARQDDDALPLAESDTDGDVNADGTVGAGYSAAGASRPTSAAVGRPPSGARSRPLTAAASHRSSAAPHRPLSGSTRPSSSSSSSQRRPLNQSAAPAASSSSHGAVDIDPTATLGTAQVLAVRAEDEGWALGRSPSTTRGSSFFDAHDTAPGITNYLRQVKRTRVSPFAVGAEKSATTRAQQASRRDRIERDRKAAASYIADYVSALGPLHLEP